MTSDGTPCSNVTNTTFLKEEKGPYNFKAWAAIKKVHVLEARLGQMLGFDILHPFKNENGSEVLWNPYDSKFEDVLRMEGNGQWDQNTVLELRNALVNASDDAYFLANGQPSMKEEERRERKERERLAPPTTPTPMLTPPEEKD